jgi:hypothetical protein
LPIVKVSREGAPQFLYRLIRQVMKGRFLAALPLSRVQTAEN